MSRRRSLPWIYQWSRPIIGAIAIVGALLTLYITITDNPACGVNAAQSASGCSGVLSSPYAYPFGRSLPKLSFFGILAYLSMASFALIPLRINPETQKKLKNQLENWTWLLLLAGGTAMAVFSSYLMYVLVFKLQTTCYYCIGSALLSLSLLIVSVIGKDWEDLGQIFFTGLIVAMVTIVATLGIYSRINSPVSASGKIPIPEASTAPEPPIGWEITTTSGEAEIALAKHLTQLGAKTYGAFWCPHCYEQKQLFGKEAFDELNYIECDPNGKNPQPQACLAAGIKSYPTWEIQGKIYPGVQTLDKLTKLSGYSGGMNFKYTMPSS